MARKRRCWGRARRLRRRRPGDPPDRARHRHARHCRVGGACLLTQRRNERPVLALALQRRDDRRQPLHAQRLLALKRLLHRDALNRRKPRGSSLVELEELPLARRQHRIGTVEIRGIRTEPDAEDPCATSLP